MLLFNKTNISAEQMSSLLRAHFVAVFHASVVVKKADVVTTASMIGDFICLSTIFCFPCMPCFIHPTQCPIHLHIVQHDHQK